MGSREKKVRYSKILKRSISTSLFVFLNPPRSLVETCYKAAEEMFPDAKISGCFFHFGQAIYRKVQKLKLAKLYADNKEVRHQAVRKCIALALVPEEDIVDGWLTIVGEAPPNEDLTEFFDYFCDTWLEGFSSNLWNVNRQRHRTNNVAEAWNRGFGGVAPAHQSLWRCITQIRDDALIVGARLRRIDLGVEKNRRRKQQIETDQRINNILDNFNIHRDLGKCLTCLSYIV